MRYLYYCNSTYQLLNVLNLHWHRSNAGFENIPDYKADLVLLNTFEGADQIADIIKKMNVFERVFLMNKTYNKGRLHGIKTLLDAVSPVFYMRDKHKMDKSVFYNRYDVISAPKYSILIDEIWRLNKKAYLDLFEDGTASYHLVIPMEPNSARVEKIREFLHVNSFRDYKHLYLVSKALYAGKDEYKVVEIPAFDKGYLNALRTAFASFGHYPNDKKIYWLSQFLNNHDFNVMVDELLSILSEYKEDVLFCQHPRKYLENVYQFEETDGKQIWEIQMLNMQDVDKKLFISIHSTACFTAKMLYDMEPYVILFYKLGDPIVTAVTDEFEHSIELFKNSYRDPSKVMIPENIEEFKACLKNYMSLVKD